MDANETPGNEAAEIPDDAIFVRQSSWAWLWYVVPWAIFAVGSLYVDQITFIGFPLVLAVIFILPRYLRWRRTMYILTDDYIMIQRGASVGPRRYDLPISDISDMEQRPGPFGGVLGYSAVHLALKDGRGVVLAHIPETSPLVEHIRARLDTSAPHEGETGA